VLKELGFSTDDIDEFRASGTIPSPERTSTAAD